MVALLELLDVDLLEPVEEDQAIAMTQRRRDEALVGDLLRQDLPDPVGKFLLARKSQGDELTRRQLTDSSPEEMVLFGVIPEEVEQGTELSKPVRDAVDAVIDAVIAELDRLGAPADLRDEPLDADLWWL